MRHIIGIQAAVTPLLIAGLLQPAAIAAPGDEARPGRQQHGAPATTGATGAPNTLTPGEQRNGWRLLWDGHTTAGWHIFGGGAVKGWEIVNGELIALGQGGDRANDIVTDDEFEHFELALDWKLSPRANSGILYNVVEQGVEVIYAGAPEYQLIDDLGWPDKLEDWQKSGANYAMDPPSRVASQPVGEWNHTRIVVDHGRVQHWLNGEKVVEYELWTPRWAQQKQAGKWKDFPKYGMARKGRIGLQDHGNKVYFRNIKIRPLPSRK